MPIYDLSDPAERLRLALDQPSKSRRQMVIELVRRRHGDEAGAELVAALRGLANTAPAEVCYTAT